MAVYFDTSALVKLIVAEPETDALRDAVRSSTSERVASDLTRTELVRAVRHGAPDRALVAREVLEAVVTYDHRLADACRTHGVAVLTPR